jgi:uncharacterized protein (DUF302 family)
MTFRKFKLHHFILGGFLAMTVAPTTHSLAASTNGGVEVTSAPLPVEHIKVTTMKPYAEVKSAIEKLGRLDDSVRALLKNDDIEGLRVALKRIAGEDGLAIHYIAQHGDLLALKGKRRPLTAYYIGNVLSAVEMTNVNPAAGLYAPLRVVVYANDRGGTTMEYDRPTSMFGQFKNAEIDAMAQSLDQRLLTFLKKVSM